MEVDQIPSQSLIKVNADIQTKGRIFTHWCSFFILVIIFIICSVFIPEAQMWVGQDKKELCRNFKGSLDADQLYSPSNIRCSPNNRSSVMFVEGIENTNMNLVTYAVFGLVGQAPGTTVTQNILYNISVLGTSTDDSGVVWVRDDILVNEYHNVSSTCTIDSEPNHQPIDGPRITNYTTQDEINIRANCDWKVVAYQPVLRNSNYLYIITPLNQSGYPLQIFLYSQTIRTPYTNSLLAIRYIFLIVSIFTGVVYYIQLRKLHKKHWILEQSSVLILSVLLPFFNDPLYAATVLLPNAGTAVIGVFFFSNFVAFLYLFWLLTYDRMIFENGQKSSKSINKVKLLVIAIFWIFLVTTYIILVVGYFNSPTATFDDFHRKAFMAFKVITIIIVVMLTIYLIRYLILFCQCYDSRLWRFKLIGVFNIFFIMCLSLFLFTGTFSLYNYSGTQVLISISILNIYIYYMQYLWAPSSVGLQEQSAQCDLELQSSQMINSPYDELPVDEININAVPYNNEEIDEKQMKPIMEE